MVCSTGSYIMDLKASYAPRTYDKCGEPVTKNWRPECASVSNTKYAAIIRTCFGQTSCKIAKLENDDDDPCPETSKFLKVIYSCAAKKSK